MVGVVRFGVSLKRELLEGFDNLIQKRKYPTRSEAIGDLIRQELVKEEWLRNKKIAGAIILVYNHHKRELLDSLADIQHDHHHLIISTQHIHLDHNNCLEIVAVRGKAEDAQRLCDLLKSTKGVKYAALTTATTGSRIP